MSGAILNEQISDGTYSADDWVANSQPMLRGGWTRPNEIQLEINGLDNVNRYDLYLASQDSFGRKPADDEIPELPNESPPGENHRHPKAGLEQNQGPWRDVRRQRASPPR